MQFGNFTHNIEIIRRLGKFHHNSFLHHKAGGKLQIKFRPRIENLRVASRGLNPLSSAFKDIGIHGSFKNTQ